MNLSNAVESNIFTTERTSVQSGESYDDLYDNDETVVILSDLKCNKLSISSKIVVRRKLSAPGVVPEREYDSQSMFRDTTTMGGTKNTFVEEALKKVKTSEMCTFCKTRTAIRLVKNLRSGDEGNIPVAFCIKCGQQRTMAVDI